MNPQMRSESACGSHVLPLSIATRGSRLDFTSLWATLHIQAAVSVAKNKFKQLNIKGAFGCDLSTCGLKGIWLCSYMLLSQKFLYSQA